MENKPSYPISKFLKDIWDLIKPYKTKFWTGTLDDLLKKKSRFSQMWQEQKL